MTKFLQVIAFLSCLSLALAITGVGLNPIRPLQLNKGLSTKYMFYINPETSIAAGGQVQITFPSEFDSTAIAAQLSCLASTPSYGWKSVPCSFTRGAVVITLGAINNEQLNILVSQPTNPSIYDMSSFFSVCLMVASMTTSCSQTFGKVVFPAAPLTTASTALSPAITSLNTLVVGQSSTYQIQFSLAGSYAVGNTIRITFPPGFLTSSTPICQMNGTYNQVITTFVWPDQRSIECQNINKTLGTGESLKIIGIFNPQFAGTFGNTNNGFKLQILQQTTTIVLEQIFIQNTVTISAGTLTGYISQANNFIQGDVVYTFYLNLLNSLTSRNFILISFDNTWLLYNGQCSVISGITLRAGARLNCTNSTTATKTILNVSNFQSASVSNQLVFSITVRSPATPGTYTVGIRTANINGTVDSMTTTVFLNSTYGDYSMLSINAIVAQSNVAVSGTGPLELTFFLNYQLPQTNVLTYGKFVIKIYPQIPLPPPLINGVLKCYFFNTIPAQTCVWDTSTSASYTLLTINTPLTMAYQYSEIPITITTEGAVNTSKIGITIADIVTRYRFELAAYQHNNSVIPTEVYFSEYIAAPISLPLTYYALTKEVNEYTHLRFEFTSPYNFTEPLTSDLRIKIEFLAGGAWAPNLGYNPNTIYKNFPCVYSDNKVQTLPPQYNSNVSCDFYTYLTGPHASLTNSTARGPYILVSGFTSQIYIGSQVRLELGKFLIGASTNLAAYIRFSIIQETPTMLTKYVELYYNEFTAFTTTTQNKPTAGTGTLTDVLANSQINAVSQHTIAYSAPSSFFAVIYEFDQISTPSFTNQFVQCTIGTAPAINWCTMLGYPLNYIVEYSYSGSFGSTVSSKLNFTNGVYSGTFTATARLFSAASITIYKQQFNVIYTPYTIPSSSYGFWMDTGTNAYLYKGSETYFYIDHTPVYDTPNNGFVRYIFSSGIQLGANPFCTSSTFVPFVSEVGLVCTLESSTSLRLSNIMGLSNSINYRLRVRLSTLLGTSSSVNPQVTIQDHYTVFADPSIVNQVNTISLNPGRTNYYNLPNEFKMNNPRVGFETPRVGYVGKFEVIFNPSGDVLVAYQIKLILNNHAWNGGYWTTPNQAVSDPMVCMINYVRVPCTYTLTPLTVTMNVSPAGIISNQDNTITLDTEYLVPVNGIVHPTQGGHYNCYLQFLTNSSTVIQQQSFYHRILPPRLRNFQVLSSVNDVGVENMFDVQFQVDTTAVNANNHATTYSRIYIEFPTVDSNNNPLFAKDLGGYSKTGDIVGCAWNTWSAGYVTAATSRLLCRLIMSEVPGEPTRVQIINHGAFSAAANMRVWIAKVFNPGVAVTSVPISIRINHVVVASNDVYELYYDTYDVFMNSQTPTPTFALTEGCQSGTDCSGVCTIFSTNINSRNNFRFSPRPLTSFSSSPGYFYALDTTAVLKPRSLQYEYSNNNCSGTYYYYCLAFPDINYIIVKAKGNSYVEMYIDAGNAISQYTTAITAKVWINQRFVGNHTISLTPTCWNQLIGAFSSVGISSTSSNGWDLQLGKRRTEVIVTFTTTENLPAGGTVLIVWPSSIPRIYPHCRSMTNLGSALVAEGTAYNGQVGCLVQNTRHWVITGFNALTAPAAIKISGWIDLPTSQSSWIGAGEIITFNSTDPTNIRSNGFIIDYYYSGSFGISINNAQALNVDGQIMFEETLPLRVGYVGPLRFKFKLNADLVGPNAGTITVRVPTKSTLAQSGGFNYVSASKHVCQFMQITTYEETGCIIKSISVDNSASTPSYMFTIVSSTTLTANILYRLVITTHTGLQPEGLTFPTAAGTYKVDINFDTTGSTGLAMHNHLYLEVYGTKFSYLQATAFCTRPGYKNLIWLKLTPTTTILSTQQLVIEVPTISASGATLFDNDLGTGVADGANIPYDNLGSSFSQTFMKCRLFYGDQANNKPGKIVCGQFSSTITSSQVLFFAFTVGNPGSFTGNQVSIPFFVYSMEQGTTYRTNFDVIENAVFLRKDAYNWNDVGSISSQSGTLQTTSSTYYIDMITRNNWNVGQGDYYVILFSFPLRINGVVTSGCTYPGGGVYGDAYYHQNLWMIVCAVTHSSNYIGQPASGYTTRNLRISNFYTPFYYLSSSERAVTCYTYMFSGKITGISVITDGYPNEGPKRSSNPTFTLTAMQQTGSRYAGSRDDYTITFVYNTVGSTIDVSFTQLVAVIFPSAYGFPESDCVQAPGSQIEIASCYIDITGSQGVIWITPVVKSSYTSDMSISILTRNLAIQNPVSSGTFNYNSFVVKYYSWQNISQPGLAPLSNNNYCFLIIDNLPSSTYSFSAHPTSYYIGSFSYIKYPHQKYYQETPFSSLVHRAPFEMEFYSTVAFSSQSGSNYNMIKIAYPSSFTDNAMVKIRDLQVFRPVCYLNNMRIKNCAIDTAANTMTMSFLFALSANTKYHLKFSILDSRNADIDGFLSSAAVSNVVLMYKPYGAGNWYYTETDQFPSLYSLPTGAATGPFRSIVAGTPTFGHSVTGYINFVSLQLTFNRTDITGLVFEIPSVDETGTALFTSQADLVSTFMSQSNGGSYPCGNNGVSAGGSVKCILLLGDYSNAGVPTRIIMTGFTYQTQMNCRFVFITPSVVNSLFSVNVHAFGGPSSALNPYGNQYMGSWQFNEIFQVTSGPATYTNSYNANSYRCPSQTTWRNNTQVYVFSRNQNIGGGRSAIASMKIYDSSSSLFDKSFCEPILASNADTDEDLLIYTLVSGGNTIKYAYFIKTWASSTDVSIGSNGWALSYLKCKHYSGIDLTANFFFSATTIQVATQNFPITYCNGYTGFGSPVSKYFSQNYFTSDGFDTSLVHEFDITPTYTGITNFQFRSGDSMVLSISYASNPWGTLLSCDLLGGVASTSINQRAFCNVNSNTNIYIVNVGGLVTDPSLSITTNYRIKVRLLSAGLVTTTNANNFNFFFQLYANYDAYNNNYHPVAYEYNGVFTGTNNLCFTNVPGNPGTGSCIISQSTAPTGTFQVQALSDTFMRVAFSPSGNLNFGATTTWIHAFGITFNGFNFGPSCSISNVVFEFSASSTPGSGTTNSVPISSTFCNYNYIELRLTGRAFGDYWGGVGASSSNSFTPGQYIIFYITISPDPSNRDLPTYHHEYLWLQGVYNYYYPSTTTWYPTVQNTVTMPALPLASSATFSALSNNVGGTTELSFTLSNSNIAFGPQSTGYLLLVEFLISTGGAWSGSSDPFASYTNTAILSDSIACKCIAGATPLSVSAASPIVDATCTRRLPNGTYSNYAILISSVNVQQTQDLICFFPEFKIPSSTTFTAEFKLVYGDVNPPELTTVTTKYSSLYRTTSGSVSYGTTPTMSITGFSTLTQTPNFYASATNVGSTYSGAYSLYGSWGANLNSPYIYLNFQSAGPIPINRFCSDLNVFLQCRVYTNLIYVVVAQLKSTSVSSFNISNSGTPLFYPPSQTSLSNYGAKIYVGVGTWQYSTSISRSQSNLTPLSSTSLFNIYSDKYGSNKVGYQTNLFFSFNPSGQFLYNNFATGSQLVISWSGLTTSTNCQVWVQGEPLVRLLCATATNSLVITSPYFDYSTSNNIIASIGLQNPSSATTFTANLYSYYYSGSRYSLTMSIQNTYTPDSAYTSYSQVAKSTVFMYPFTARISTVANAPLRVRFTIPSSSVANANGLLVFTNSQIQYSSAHLCYIIVYNSYTAMSQQTQRNVYKTSSCTSSGSTLFAAPPRSLTLVPNVYYELVMMPLGINSLGCSTYGCVTQSGYQQTNFDTVSFIAYNSYSTAPICQQTNKLYNYEGSSFIGLQQIYILTTQPTITSLYLSININFTSSYNYPTHFLEITLFDLKIAAFPGYSIGDIIPCQLSSNFLNVSARQAPQCRVVVADQVNDFVTVRIENFGFLSQQTYWVALDDIVFPTPSSSDNNNKFDIAISYFGPSNVRYSNFFPEILQIDNTNQTAAVTSSSYTFNNPAVTGFGSPITGQVVFNWPFDTTSSGYESKIALNINGGYSATWSNINTVTFVDSTGTYQLLWVNTKLNKFIFLIPNKGNAVSTTLNITSLNNPYPYQKPLYTANNTMIINFYNNFFLANKQTFNQPSFSIFTMNPSLVYINQNFPCNTIDFYPGNTFAPSSLNVLLLSISFDESPANILLRNLGDINIKFTSGVNFIRECRAMRNNTQYINTNQVCQPFYDGTNWNVKLYDVANSQLTTGWWVQVFATFNSATLTYTSTVMASNNLVVEYSSTYTMTMAGYNSSRTIPTTLAWLNNKYVANFHETQYIFKQAVTGQSTQYLKFRFTAPPAVSIYSDVFYIYLAGTAGTAFSPKTSGSNIIAQFLPSMGVGDRDFSIGTFSECTLDTSGTYYYTCYMRYAGLTPSADYLIQISEYNTATSSFNMPTSPGRQELRFYYRYYPSGSDWRYYDAVNVFYYRYFRNAQFLHTTTTASDYETITINYTPYGNLGAVSSSNQIALRLSVQARYHDQDGGISAIYTADSKVLQSGSKFSGVVSNPNGAEINTIQFSQYGIELAPLRFVLAKQSAYTDNTAYYWIVPLLKNPSAAYVTLRYNLTLVNSPASAYQRIINHYESLNEYYTVSSTATSLTTSITNNLRAVQTVNAVDLSVSLGPYSLTQWNTAIFKINNALPGLLQSIATPNDTSNYNYYYFDNINMIMAQKKTSNSITNIGIGSASSALNYQSTFGLSWVKVFSNSNAPMATNPYTIYYSTPSTLTLTYLTSYASSSITLIEGYQYKGSTAMYKVTFTTPIIPLSGQIRILFDNTLFTSDNNAPCRANTNIAKSPNANDVLRCYRVSQGFRIAGFNAIPASTSISAYFMLKSTATATSSPIQVDIYGIYQDNTTRISLASVGTVSHAAGTCSNSLYRFEQTVKPYFSTIHPNLNNVYTLEGTFNLRQAALSNGHYIYIIEPGWNDNNGVRRLLIKQNSSSVTGWTELAMANTATNQYRFTIPPDYLMTQTVAINTQYIFRYYLMWTGSYNNGFNMGGTGVSKFRLYTHTSSWQEIGLLDFVPYPSPNVLTVTNRYKAAGRQTVLDLQWSSNIDAGPGNKLVVSFDTSNLLYQMFANDLQGVGVGNATYRYLDCRQWTTGAQISPSRIVCLLNFGNNLANPPIPANLTITFQQNSYGYSSSNTIRILIGNVMNPTTVGLNTGITVNVFVPCENQQNQPCSDYTARGYYVTTSETENLQTTNTSFSSSSNLVLKTGLTHTFTLILTAAIGTSDAIYIVYPENFQGVMPSDCSASGYTCFVFPTRRWVMLIPNSGISSGSKTITITSMNNPYYSQPYSQYFLVTVARSGALGDTYRIMQNAFTPVSYTFGDGVTATSITVSTTQTPNMYLRNYANTVIFTIANLFSDSRMKAIYILAPDNVTSWDPTYCNASLTTTKNYNYPLRFTCIVDPNTPQYLRLTLDSDMATYDSSWAYLSIRVHAKFTLADFPTPPTLYVTSPAPSDSFYAYSSVNASSSSSLYYMSQCSLTVSISQNQVPVISVINFNTQSFANRVARVNNKEIFYMLFKPLVDVDIGSVVFTIPSQFNYPGVFQFDNCLMIGRTTIPQGNCQLSRSQGQTLVTLVPDNYDKQVKIFQIGTVLQSNWFTAPSLPGDFYNMNVAIYSNTGTLIAKQTRNISPVYGRFFDIPSMTIKNVQDASSKLAVYDISFVTGDLQIPPGTLTTATTQTSELRFIFENFNGMNPTNVFSNDLGTGLSNGDQIGCKFFSGLVAVSGLRLKCLLYVGTNSTNKPMIRVINYNFINPSTTIIIGFAGIQSLPAVLVNTISIGVVIFYTDIGSSTYLYIPTPIITVPTNATNMFNSMPAGWDTNWLVNASYSGTNIVLQPTTFTISFRIPYMFWTHPTFGFYLYDYVYSSTGADDQFILMTFYPHTLLDKNNPMPVACATCTSVDVFYASGTVRFRHSTSTSGSGNRAFTFTNFPTSAYSMLNQTVSVYFQIFQSYQAIFQRNVTVNLSRTVEKCTKFNFGVVSVSSLNGGEIGVTYLFSIKTNHFVPADGAISITIPTVYGNLVSNMATCTLIGFANTNSYCSILTPSRVDIYANGTQLSPSTTYSIQITGMQNPNVQSSNFVFIVTSYYVSNIYLGLKICENQIIPPAINVKPLRTCTLSWTPQYYNQNFNTTYVFQLSCSDVFRGDSILYISLPTAFSSGNRLGTYACSSYESTTLISPVCTLQNINGVFTLTTNIDASSQSSLSVILNLVNPINNTYVASAYVNSKGTQYASSGNSSITILSNPYSTAQSSDVSLLNMPKEAGLMSTYAFKISPISTFSPSNLGISFPSNFYIDSTKITVSILNHAQNNIFSLLTYNNIQSLISNASRIAGARISSYPTFKVVGTSVYLLNITGQVSSSLWTYVFVSNIQNPSAYVYANFTVAYYLISNGFQALQWAFQRPLTYYISSPPQYISINSVAVTDYDLLYPANYTFNISATTPIAISGKNLSYIIVIPTFYKNTLWANTPPVCKFSVLNAASSCYSYQSEIIVTEVFPANYSTLSLTISTLLNPSLPTSCNTTDTTILAQTFFIVRIIDTVSNSFLFESSSVVDSTNCLTFSAIRIPISLEYSLIMTAGLAYNITYGLSKSSSNLKITAFIANSGFTFSPATVDFSNHYVQTKSTQLFLRSDVSPGTYVIYFNKSEASNQTEFRNILPVTITVTASNTTSTSTYVTIPTISIPSMSDSTIGYPVTIPVHFSLPSSTEMTLFMSVSEESNQTLVQYSSAFANATLTPRIFNILPQQTLYNYTLVLKTQLVPPPLTLNFKLTSNYPIVHKLTTPVMYLCFDRDPKFNVLYPPLRVTVTQFLSSCNLRDVGKQVTNIYVSNETSQSSAGSVTPKIISMTVNSVASTGAVITINSISSGTIYYACISAGYPNITNTSVLISSNISQGVAGSAQSSPLDVKTSTTAQINFVATATITGLNQSSNYVFYALSQSNLGTSTIKSVNFATTGISKGVQFRMYFTSVITNLVLVNSLVRSLRVNPGRIKILTSIVTLQKQANISQSSNNKPKFAYDIVLAPDESNDIISPMTTISNFARSTSALASFQSGVPSFDVSTPITFFELRPVDPQLNYNPKINQINNYNASFNLYFKSQTNVYAVLIETVGNAENSLASSTQQINPQPVSALSPAAKAKAPSSSQIKAGTDCDNKPLGKYKVVQITTDENGNGMLVFSDLKERSTYTVYLTASSPLPYEPTMLWPDSKVITFGFSTLPNPNIGDSKKQLEYINELANINPSLKELSDAMKRHVAAQESIRKANDKK